MKNMNEKRKKQLVAVVGLAVSAALIGMIALQFRTAPVKDVELPPQIDQVPNVVVESPHITEKEISVAPIEIPTERETTSEDDTATEQTIQPDIPEKPTYSEEDLTNSNQKPNGEKVEPPTPENPNPPQTQEKPVNPTGGLPGFDHVPNMGENKNIYVDGMKENGNKVGIMD